MSRLDRVIRRDEVDGTPDRIEAIAADPAGRTVLVQAPADLDLDDLLGPDLRVVLTIRRDGDAAAVHGKERHS